MKPGHYLELGEANSVFWSWLKFFIVTYDASVHFAEDL